MKQRFEEIDVERINVVDPDGTLRLTIANGARQPDAVMDGQVLRTREGETSAGFIFFNDEGDECGGFTWHGAAAEGGSRAGAGFAFDQFKQDETLRVSYSEQDGKRFAGVVIQDRPTEAPISRVVVEELHPAMRMDDGPEKDAKIASIRSKFAPSTRVLLGRTEDGEASLALCDSKGRPRIRLCVDPDDTPRFEMLGEDGEVVFSLPPTTP